MLPYPKSAPYFDSLPLLEVTDWDVGTIIGEDFDVVDVLEAIHSAPPPLGTTQVYAGPNSDPRYVVTWAVQGTGWNLDPATMSRAHFVLQGDSGSGNTVLFAPADMHVVPLAEAVTVTIGDSSLVRRNLNGVLRVNCRRIRCALTMTGPAPGLFRFGSFLRVI